MVSLFGLVRQGACEGPFISQDRMESKVSWKMSQPGRENATSGNSDLSLENTELEFFFKNLALTVIAIPTSVMGASEIMAIVTFAE